MKTGSDCAKGVSSVQEEINPVSICLALRVQVRTPTPPPGFTTPDTQGL